MPSSHTSTRTSLPCSSEWRSAETEALLRSLSRFQVFFKFVGIGSETFSFLEKLDDLSGRTVDNADYIYLSDLTTVTASELYVRLLQEIPEWTVSARAAGVL